MKRKTKIAYDISINKRWDVFMRCKEHIKHYREHWGKQLNLLIKLKEQWQNN